jgi:hypothetical protein
MARIPNFDDERNDASASPEIASGLWVRRRAPLVYSDAPERARSEITTIITVAALAVVLATLFFGAA